MHHASDRDYHASRDGFHVLGDGFLTEFLTDEFLTAVSGPGVGARNQEPRKNEKMGWDPES